MTEAEARNSREHGDESAESFEIDKSGKSEEAAEEAEAKGSREADRIALFGIRHYLFVVLVLLAIVLVASYCRRDRTRVSLNVQSQLVDITTSASSALNELLLTNLYIESDRLLVRLPEGRTLTTDYFEAGADTVTVASIEIHDDARITLRAGEADGVTIGIHGSASPIEIMLPPDAEYSLGGDPQAAHDSYVQIVAAVEGESFVLGGRLAGSPRLFEAMPIRALGYWQRVTQGAADREVQLSTVETGVLVLEESGGERIDLWQGEPISLGALDGLLRTASIEEEVIQTQFDGWTREIRSGYTSRARSLMPSYLDWLTNIPAVKAVLALLAVLVGGSLPLWKEAR